MPYIALKAHPRSREAQIAGVEKLKEALMEVWGVPESSISISLETVTAEDWEEQVVKKDIEANWEKVMIFRGKKLYEE